jgi:DNA-binding transcriptional ArsR family regulator
MDAALRAIADPIRREILGMVWREERTAGEIAARFEVSQPAISQHLKVLRETGLVAVRRDGTRRFYRADQTAMAALRATIEAFWDDRLAALKTEAEASQRRKDTDAC